MEVNASTFKSKCLALLEQTRQHGTEIVITKRGKPVARLVPAGGAPAPRSILGALEGTGQQVGDIVQPTEAEWLMPSLLRGAVTAESAPSAPPP